MLSIKSYDDARNLFENTRKRKLARNKFLTKTAKGYGIVLYNTTIVEYLDNNRVRLNTGGWHTPTTWRHISKHAGFSVGVLGFKRNYDMPDGTIVDVRSLKVLNPKVNHG